MTMCDLICHHRLHSVSRISLNCSPTGDNNYECLCDDHWGGDFCDEFSHCNPNPCENDAKCVEKGNHFQCDCQVSNTF